MALDIFGSILFVASVLAAGIASVAGFGIGSVLTPLAALQTDMKVAVAAISIPHLVATAIRCWLLRREINKDVLIKFGSFSAIGGLIGAIFHNQSTPAALMYVFAGLLLYVGLIGLLNMSKRLAIPHKWSWLAGIGSGLLGGLVGNQGGIRSAALAGGYHMNKTEFVATATAIGIIVDLVRMPVYLWTEYESLLQILPLIAISTIGCIVGTIAGKSILQKLSDDQFRITVSILFCLLGIYMLVKAFAPT